MRFLYSTGVILYYFFLRIAGIFSSKARAWHYGRKELFDKLDEVFSIHYANEDPAPVAWFHCASLGEFEQGKPVIEAYHQEFPGHLILLTFFSPSGYNHHTHYDFVDHVFYLPIDTIYNARRFVNIVRPSVALFVKYEFWFNYLNQLFKHSVPVFTISAIFRPDQHFFKWYGGWFRTHLRKIKMIFVQDKESAELLHMVDVTNVLIGGDTRFDRVLDLKVLQQPFPLIDAFVGSKPVLVAGSTWQQDEEVMLDLFRNYAGKVKFIIAPHEFGSNRIKDLLNLLGEKAEVYSNAQEVNLADKDALIIDSIGILSQLYRYASIAYIGGGFGAGIHNTLEAAAFGVPVFFGPNFNRFREARDMVAIGTAFNIANSSELLEKVQALFSNQERLEEVSAKAGKYVMELSGATRRIMNVLGPEMRGINE
ncbi:MAG: glycosyltransferase N-terminal domain-containing protein [Lentimicrobium sp.]|jgi:3-deoxy-D-manno-octulosonic-acid transferase|nr:glycosyltransferase N-terminal domain-containing protein [Lentimicrobium sp.]